MLFIIPCSTFPVDDVLCHPKQGNSTRSRAAINCFIQYNVSALLQYELKKLVTFHTLQTYAKCFLSTSTSTRMFEKRM